MAFITANRTRETTLTTGTSPKLLGGAQFGYRAFSQAMSVGDTATYTEVDPVTGFWEVGIGQLMTGGTLRPIQILDSSNFGAAIVFGIGVKDIFIDIPASSLAPLVNGSTGVASLTASTTGAVTARLTTDGNAPNASNTLNLLPPYTVARYLGSMLAKDVSSNDTAAWDVSFAIRQDGGTFSMVASSVLGGHEYSDSSMTGVTFANILADAANGGVNISGAGVAGKTINWTFTTTMVQRL